MSFYRAGVFHSDAKLRKALERPVHVLGPPPTASAVAGHMNARGGSLFYGATDGNAALAEVRPPVGSRALVARFDVRRPLRLLDVKALRSIYVDGSVFDTAYMTGLELAKFLETLGRRMTMPAMPGDEPSECLVTQVIADHLASNLVVGLDGILYPSVQRSGEHQNVVLFRRVSQVAPQVLPGGASVAAHLVEDDDSGWSSGYAVFEKMPSKVPAVSPVRKLGRLYADPSSGKVDRRDLALSLVMQILCVYQVDSVEIGTDKHVISRHRFQGGPRCLVPASGGSD